MFFYVSCKKIHLINSFKNLVPESFSPEELQCLSDENNVTQDVSSLVMAAKKLKVN